jgi:D-proline reductase (dithiol) PrdB
VGLIQRVLDQIGIATISLTLVKEMTQLVKPSKALYVQHPFGLTLGDVGDAATHAAILSDCLRHAAEVQPPGTIIDLPSVWTKDDLRERQLRKEAH